MGTRIGMEITALKHPTVIDGAHPLIKKIYSNCYYKSVHIRLKSRL